MKLRFRSGKQTYKIEAAENVSYADLKAALSEIIGRHPSDFALSLNNKVFRYIEDPEIERFC